MPGKVVPSRRSCLLWACAIVLSGLTIPITRGQTHCGAWIPLSDFDSPRFFRVAGVVYDTSQSVTTLVQWADGADSNEMWSWEGTRWTSLPGDGPAAVGAAVYDSVRDVIVLVIEGDNEDGPGETWEWDGAAWSLVSETGPASRIHQRLVFDAHRGVTLLFGGYDAGYLGDTWTWDGEAWTQVSDVGPSPRWAHDLAYDSARGVTVLFGGFAASGRVSDTWEWNGAQWTQVSDEGPSPRGLHAMSYDVARGVTVLYGGSSPQNEHDTWHWDGTSWVRMAMDGPGGSVSHRMSYDATRQVNVLVGGELGVDTWLWDGMQWTVQIPDQPAPGTHDMVWDTGRDVGVLCESHVGSGDAVRKTWVFNDDGWTLASQTSPEFSGPMAYDVARRVVLMFNYAMQTWAWDGGDWFMVSETGPSEVSAMAYDQRRGVVVALGPYNRGRCETWEWDGSAWLLRSTTGPRYRTGTAMVYDPAGDVTMIFGGVHHTSEDSIYYNDTWVWNGATWHQVSTTGPSARADHTMIVDGATGLVLLHGGNIAQEMNAELWVWDGRVWRFADFASGPQPRTGAAMVYDAVQHRTLVFGGRDEEVVYGDLWALDLVGATPVLSVASSCPATGPGEIAWSCATPGGRVVIAYALRPGSVVIPPAFPCAGVQLGLEYSTLRFVDSAISDTFGRGVLIGSVPAAACGGYLQLVDVERCRVSNVAILE